MTTMRALGAKTCVLLLIAMASACGGSSGNSVTGPTSGPPAVAGNYSGTVTLTSPGVASDTCPANTVVSQSGNSVNVAAIQLGGACARAGLSSFPFATSTMDNAGNLGAVTGSVSAACGTYTISGTSGFFQRELRITASYTSSTCNPSTFQLNFLLSR